MELLKGGRLSEIIWSRKKDGKRLSGTEISTIMRGIMEAIKYIHSKGIAHLDVKPGKTS